MNALSTFVALLLAVGCHVASAQGSYSSAVIGTTKVRLPDFEKLAPACQQEPRLFAVWAAGLPQDQRLIACWIDASVWKEVKRGKPVFSYPNVSITYAHALGSDWTASSFQEVRAAAEQTFGKSSLAGKPVSQSELQQHNKAAAEVGARVEELSIRPQFVGIYESASTSFSFLMVRNAEARFDGKLVNVKETFAMTNMLFGGHLILIAVATQGVSEQSAQQAKELMTEWTRAFKEGNSRYLSR